MVELLLEHRVSLLSLALLLSLLLPITKLREAIIIGITKLGLRLNNSDYSPTYLQVAGGGLFICLYAPLAAAYWALAVLAPWPSLLEPLLLWLFLDVGRLRQAVPACLAHAQQQTPLARLSLAPLCLRHTDALSPLGVYKAVAETSTLRLAGDFALLFWYLAGGIYSALLFGILRLAVQAWPVKLAPWRPFGQVASVSYRALAWLPLHLLALTLLIYPGSKRALNAWPQGKLWAYPAAGRLLAVVAAGVACGLGGPRRYTQATEYYPKLGSSQLLTLESCRRLLLRLVVALLFWLSLAWLLLLVPYFYG